ncbi:MAG TPA: flavoprotein [Stackebrandtia sp.]|jgi:phosphopantothenoylcysteine synthetase/decarboxylase|uniref:flavoprotein n=1 Tax=Stackebrandtia sp. TaxID=2023065 RepID=UPI002D6C63CC|nr:flavoprotein [Stackebrandtia sp.]HZE39962.1 flavoprotein [Stackebrandtia sp.]
MPFQPTGDAPVLEVIVCGSPLAREIDCLLHPLVAGDWDVWVVATPDGRRFFDTDLVEKLTGHPVHSRYRRPDEQVDVPYADLLAVVPATCNTINKWAAGICDTLALGLLVEAYGRRCPIVTVPYTNRDQAAHPMFVENLERLRRWGVRLLYGEDFHPLHAPGAGDGPIDFPWHRVRDAIEEARPVTWRR